MEEEDVLRRRWKVVGTSAYLVPSLNRWEAVGHTRSDTPSSTSTVRTVLGPGPGRESLRRPGTERDIPIRSRSAGPVAYTDTDVGVAGGGGVADRTRSGNPRTLHTPRTYPETLGR